MPSGPPGWCVSCQHHLHGACMGWWDFCTCECGLGGPGDPLRIPEQSNNDQGES